jgi:hypothetical protein
VVRRRLSPALVLSLVACFVALGGPAFAENTLHAAKKLINGKRIKKGTITTKQIKDGTLLKKDFAAGVLPVAPDLSGFYTKGQSDSRFLGKSAKAANADQLDGLDSSAIARGNAAVYAGRGVADANGTNDTVPVLSIPGIAVLENECHLGSDGPEALFTNHSGGALDWTLITDSAGSSGNNTEDFQSGTIGEFGGMEDFYPDKYFTLLVSSGTGDTAKVAEIRLNGTVSGSICQFTATAVATKG